METFLKTNSSIKQKSLKRPTFAIRWTDNYVSSNRWGQEGKVDHKHNMVWHSISNSLFNPKIELRSNRKILNSHFTHLLVSIEFESEQQNHGNFDIEKHLHSIYKKKNTLLVLKMAFLTQISTPLRYVILHRPDSRFMHFDGMCKEHLKSRMVTLFAALCKYFMTEKKDKLLVFIYSLEF